MLGTLCTLAGVSALPLRVSAQPTPAAARIVVIRADDASRDRAGGVAIELVAALSRRGIPARLPPAPEPEPDERAGVDEAEQAYHALRPEDAARAIDAILARVDARGTGLDREPLLRALLVLAMSRAALGQHDAADAAIDRALAVEPALAPDPTRYPPTLRQRVEARRAALGSARATLRVAVVPADAQVAIDGEPGAAREVAPGRHLVQASAPRRRPAGRAVDVPAEGISVELALALDPAAALASPGAPGAPVDPALDEAARALDGELLVLDLVAEGGGTSIDAIAGARRAHAHLDGDAAPAAACDAIAAALAASPEGGVDPVPWIALGGGVAAAAAIAIVIGVVVSSQTPAGFDARGEVLRP